jgi:hypothetical protein
MSKTELFVRRVIPPAVYLVVQYRWWVDSGKNFSQQDARVKTCDRTTSRGTCSVARATATIFLGMSAHDDVLFKASFSSGSSLVALQLFSRLFTFVLNQALLRLASPRAYGTIAIQFELMLNTVLFISREGVRNTLLRVRKPGTLTSSLSTLPLLLGVPLALATSCLYAFSAPRDVRFQPHFNVAIGIYALAAVTELMSEPLHNLYVCASSALVDDRISK